MQLNDSKELTKECVICGSEKLDKVYHTYDRHYGNTSKFFDVNECDQCGLLFLNPMIGAEELHSMYSEDSYYAYQPYETQMAPASLLRRIVRKLVTIKPGDPLFNAKGLHILDVGCGSGKELYQYKKNGAHVAGVEISKSGSAFGNEHGLNIFNGSLLEANFEKDRFDYIRSNHAFEHITNPVSTAEEIYRITKPGGKVFIGVPNSKSLPYRLFKKYWYYLGVPFHPYNYNPENLIKLFTSFGFKVDKVQYNGNLHGLLGSLQIYLNRKNGKSSEEGSPVHNQILRILAHQTARLLNWAKKGDCIEVIFTKPAK